MRPELDFKYAGMKEVIEFLSELKDNNNREWFEANRSRYAGVKKVFDAFATELIAHIGAFDPSTAGLGLKDCTYRIYRDTRFSHDKTPYKTHMGVYVCRGGKKSGYAGYYFHVEPGTDGRAAHGLMSAGLYMPEGNVLKSMREEIYDNGAALEADVCAAGGFALDTSNKLKRLPAGYPADAPHGELLKQKDLYLVKYFDEAWLLQKELAAAAAREFERTLPFVLRLNRAVEYAHEEME